MRIGVPREPVDQPRAAASPQTVERMIRLGYEVLIEHGAGGRAQFPDDAYEAAGAQTAGGAQVWGCEVVVSASSPAEEQLALMSRGAVLICRLDPVRRGATGYRRADPRLPAHGPLVRERPALPAHPHHRRRRCHRLAVVPVPRPHSGPGDRALTISLRDPLRRQR